MTLRTETLNLDADGAVAVKGPQVAFKFKDKSKALVAATVSVSDGTHLSYPNGGADQSSTFKQGMHFCTVVVTAMKVEGFGAGVDLVMSIGGIEVLRAKGSVTAASGADSSLEIIKIVVR